MTKFFTLITLFCSSILLSQSYHDLYKNYTSQQTNGQYKESRQTAFEILKKFPTEIIAEPIQYADLLNTIGNYYFEENKFDSAYANFSKAVNLVYAVKADTSFDYAFYLQNAATTLAYNGNYQLAEKYFLISLPKLANFLGASSLEYTLFYKQYVDMKIEAGDYQTANPLNDALLHYFKTLKGDNDTYYLNCLNNKARICQGLGNYKEAASLFLQVLDNQTKFHPEDLSNIATAYNNAAECNRMMGNYDAAELYYLQCLEIETQLNKNYSTDKASVLNNMGLLYKAKSDYAKSEKCFLQSIENYQALNYQNTADFANPVNNIGDLYRMMGNYKKAIQYCSYAVEVRKNTTGEEHEYYANAITNMALVYMDFDHLDEAEKLLQQAEKIYKMRLGESHVRYSNSLSSLSSLYARKKDYTKALYYKNQCLSLMEKNGAGNTDRYALYLNGKASIECAMQKYDNAIVTYQQAASIFKKNFGSKNFNYVDVLFSVATTYEMAGKSKQARDYYLKSMLSYKQIIHDNFVGMSEEEKVNFYYTISNRFQTFYSFCLSHSSDKNFINDDSLKTVLFNVRLSDKSLLLNENDLLFKKLSQNNDTAINNTFTKWLDTKKYLQDLYKYSYDELAQNNIHLDEVEEYKNNLEKSLNENVAGFKDIQLEKNDFLQIKHTLNANDIALEIIRCEIFDVNGRPNISYGAMIVAKDYKSPRVIVLDSCAFFDSLFVEQYKNAIQTQSNDLLSYNRFFKVFEKHIANSKHLYFSPDGVYQKLNLYTLYDHTKKQYILEQLDVSHLTSLKDLLNSTEQVTSQNNITLFGYPEYELKNKSVNKQQLEEALTSRFGFSEFPELPGTKKETESIALLFQEKKWITHLYLSAEANEEKIKQVINPKILHIATHGFFLPDEDLTDEKTFGFSTEQAKQNPLLRCGLVMAGAATYVGENNLSMKDDGILTAYEASLLNLQGTELVTLSACETGLGEMVNGQGVYGLQRAFLTAGAKSVLMSLWEVDDTATQELMILFYQAYLNTNNAKDALRKSQTILKQKYPQPLFWGAFVLIEK